MATTAAGVMFLRDRGALSRRPNQSARQSPVITTLRKLVSLRCITGAALILAGCHSSITGPDALTGVWGGRHAQLTVTESGGVLEFDCAHGEITTPLAPDRNGRFAASGYYVAEGGGPTPNDVPERRQPTVYSGQVSGATLAFRFALGNQQFGPFAVERDRPATLIKCR